MQETDKLLYFCDPSKNTECRKTGCYLNGGPCRHTTHVEYADTTDYAFPAMQGTEWAQIVRCKDCKWYAETEDEEGNIYPTCEHPEEGGGWTRGKDWHCADGEPREGNDGKVY